MQTTFLIKGGSVVDGTGVPPFMADVRIAKGIIDEIGPSLDRRDGERLVDATGCYVAPGFIEPHNHFDGPMWWSPTMEPMSGYGVTTSINGNCGFSVAPLSDDPEVRADLVEVFSFIEDIPGKPFTDALPWDWHSWSEYRDSVERNLKLPVNYASFCGHVALRLAAMGESAWERAATEDETAQMCVLLEDSLKAGALGLSSNLLDNDRNGREIVTRHADDAEWEALLAVLARHPCVVLQVIVDNFLRRDAAESMARLAPMLQRYAVRTLVHGAVPSLNYQAAFIPDAIKRHRKLNGDGLDIWAGYHHVAPTVLINFQSSLVWLFQHNAGWHEIIEAGSDEARFALLRSEEWREHARKTWDSPEATDYARSPETYELFDSESGAGPTGLSLGDYMKSEGFKHPSDALAHWVLENGSASNLRMADVPKDRQAMDYLLSEPRTMGNQTDAGAHGKMLCGIGENILMLTHFVRDTGQLAIEQAVHILTGKIAGLFGLSDRGVLKPGLKADLVVFDLDEIDCRPEYKMFDVPDGEGGRTYRYSRPPAPMRLTLVNGVATFDRNSFTGYFPGEFIGPGSEGEH